MMSNPIVMALAPVFFVLLLGYAAGKFRVVDNHQVDGLNALVMDFALPASLFAATASATRSQMIEQAPLFLVFGLTMLLLYVGWFLAVRLFTDSSRSEASLQALTIGFPNLAGVGLPIVASVLGPTGTVPVAVALAAGSILISPLTLIIVEMSSAKAHGGEISAQQILTAIRRALTKPIVLAPALGILLSMSGLELDALAHACLSLIGSAAAGVALFLTGLILSAQSFRLDWKVVAATAASDVIRPLLAVAIVFLFPISSEAAKTAILLAAVPSGF
ncbi:MAG: AEC family transporter, partial [Bradyrhizobium sp.]